MGNRFLEPCPKVIPPPSPAVTPKHPGVTSLIPERMGTSSAILVGTFQSGAVVARVDECRMPQKTQAEAKDHPRPYGGPSGWARNPLKGQRSSQSKPGISSENDAGTPQGLAIVRVPLQPKPAASRPFGALITQSYPADYLSASCCFGWRHVCLERRRGREVTRPGHASKVV